MEEERNNRFNGNAAQWHGLLWLVIIVLVCLGWTLFLSGCSTKRSLASDTSIVSDSSVVRSTSSVMDSMAKDSAVVISSEENRSKSVHDSVFVSQVIEREIIIRQDSSGKELSRVANTTITNNRDRVRNVSSSSFSSSEIQSKVDKRKIQKQNVSTDSISAKNTDKNKVVTVTETECVNVWARIKQFFKFIGNLLLFCLQATVIGVVVYVFGGICIWLYRLAKKVHANVKTKMRDNGKEK